MNFILPSQQNLLYSKITARTFSLSELLAQLSQFSIFTVELITYFLSIRLLSIVYNYRNKTHCSILQLGQSPKKLQLRWVSSE